MHRIVFANQVHFAFFLVHFLVFFLRNLMRIFEGLQILLLLALYPFPLNYLMKYLLNLQVVTL